MAMFAAAAILPGASPLYAAVTVGGSASSPYIFANPFVGPNISGGGTQNYTAAVGFGTTPATIGTTTALPDGVVDRFAGRVASDAATDVGAGYIRVPRYVDNTTYYQGSAYLQDTLNSGTFTAGGLISVRHYYSTSFTGTPATEPYSVSLGGTQVQPATGTIAGDVSNSNKYQLTLFNTPVTANSVKVDFSSMAIQASATRSYASVQEALLLPVVGSQIPILTTGVTDTANAGPTFVGGNIADNDELAVFYAGTSTASVVTVNLGTASSTDTFDLGTLVVTTLESKPCSFQLSGSTDGGTTYLPLLGGGTVVIDISETAILNTLNVNALGLDHIKFAVNATNPGSGIAEIFAFQPAVVPEPAGLSLLAAGGLALLRRRRRA
ncbi:MAG TPA: PEP-CTERM sorting domain-containing protein [Tepidisphaeraceae bacterium]|jgi:hypothetical protein